MPTKTEPTTNHERLVATMEVTVREPSNESRRVVGAVLARSLADHRAEEHERVVFETPGVIEALDAALDEVAALKRSM